MSAILDTQMTDYASDIDVLMQPHSDPWIQEDGSMDDDSFNSYNQTDSRKPLGLDSMGAIESGHIMSLSTFSGSSAQKDLPLLGRETNPVEVDMEEYTETHEYEMLDDDENRIDQDVQVHDVQVGGPAIDASPQISYSHSNETTASTLEISSLVNPELPFDLSRESSLPILDSSRTHEPHFITQDHNETSDGIESSASIEPQPISEGTGLPAEDAHEAAESDHHDTHVRSASSQLIQPTEAEYSEFESSERVGGENDFAASTSASKYVPSGLSSERVLQDSVSAVEESESAAVYPHIGDVLHEDQDGAAAPASNPHEISDGVYIEPPPPVLIEILSSEHTFSIFNRLSTSGRSTPSPEDAKIGEDMHVLLHDRPTLFYEPVFAVFEALRHEEPFYDSANFRDVELVFEIPSLKLLLSEDNVYAREVSLHDLSILHDSFGAAGPLRLQLRIQGSRFILRYSELQDHLHRMILAEDQKTTFERTEEEASHGSDDNANEKGEDDSSEYPEPQNEEPLDYESFQQERAEQLAPDVVEDLDDTDLASGSAPDGFHHDVEAPEEGNAPVDDHAQVERESTREDAEADSEEAQEVSHESDANEVEDATHISQSNTAVNVDDADLDSLAVNVDQQSVAQDEEVEHPDAVFEEEDEYYEEEDYSETTTETPGDAVSENVEDDATEKAEADTNPDPVPHPEGQVDLLPLQEFGSSDHTDNDHPSEVVETVSPIAASVELPQEDPEGTRTDDLINYHTDSKVEADNEQKETRDFTELPDLPDDDEFWDDEQDGEGEIDLSWDGEHDETVSDKSSVTLSSKGSKRSYSEVDGDHEAEDGELAYIPSPEKRTRLE